MSTVNINILLKNRPMSCRYGAPLGARNVLGEEVPPLHLQRVRFVDYCYGADGTYWGMGQPLYAAFTPDLATLLYVRANSRRQARETLLNEYDVTFKV